MFWNMFGSSGSFQNLGKKRRKVTMSRVLQLAVFWMDGKKLENGLKMYLFSAAREGWDIEGKMHVFG